MIRLKEITREKFDECLFLDVSKKKIRVYKRRVKQIEVWKQRNLSLNEEMLEMMSRDYVKMWIYPFYSLSEYTL